MVRNPGELEHAGKSCGQSGCHAGEVERVKKSLMATNRGIISTLRFYWGETDDHDEDITVHGLVESGATSPALDYYRKLCGTCHLWMPKNSFPGFLAEKGGGCSACHTPAHDDFREKPDGHPGISRRIPLRNCVRCHNRSGRIGLSYQGKYESEGYGSPFHEGGTSDLELSDGRFFRKIEGDLHYRAGLVCVDCHTGNGIMGNGTGYAHIEGQVEISCETCHVDMTQLASIAEAVAAPDSIAGKTALSKALPLVTGVVRHENQVMLKGKLDGRFHPLRKLKPDACRNRLHARLSCQACHSPWVPQCYGCHVRADAGKRELDKLAMKETPGMWQEFKSWMRYESPVLGVAEPHRDERGRAHAGEVVILVPG
jgi:hypothetical protein